MSRSYLESEDKVFVVLVTHLYSEREVKERKNAAEALFSLRWRFPVSVTLLSPGMDM